MNFKTATRILMRITTTFTIIGFIANIISVSYFIKSERKGLPNKLMICLNFTDVLASLTLIVYDIFELVIYIHEFVTGNVKIVPYKNIELVVTATFNTACIISGCLTFGLTLLRTIVICNPFYRIKQKLCVSCLIVLLVVLVALMQILAFWTDLLPLHYREFTICGVMTAILSCCNIFMSAATIIVLKKTRGDGQQERNHAAVTMVIISVIYFTTSFPVLITLLIPVNGSPDRIFKACIYVVLLSLSSLLNPIVYIFRKRQMRRFIKEQFHKLMSCCWKFNLSLISSSPEDANG